MENTIEIRYENVLETIRQMPAEQLTKLLTDVRRILQNKKMAAAPKKEVVYRPELLESMAQLERGEGIRVSMDELKQMLFN